MTNKMVSTESLGQQDFFSVGVYVCVWGKGVDFWQGIKLFAMDKKIQEEMNRESL